MKIRYSFIIGLFAIGLFSITSCEKDKTCGFGDLSDYIVFGHFYGKCAGEECIEIFKLDAEHLFEDTLDTYPLSDDFYPGHFVTQWSNEKFDLVRNLESFFPEALLNETAVIQGQPDAGDWGGIYFEIKRGDTHRFWLLDQMDDHMPAAYNTFVDRINEKISLIHQ